MARSLAVEWAKQGVRVNCISYVLLVALARWLLTELSKAWICFDKSDEGHHRRKPQIAGRVVA